jgi:hypothetical protein
MTARSVPGLTIAKQKQRQSYSGVSGDVMEDMKVYFVPKVLSESCMLVDENS